MENETAATPITVQEPIQVPNSSGILAMGILSIVCFCCLAAGVIGITLGILALVLGNKALKLYNENPSLYTETSFKNAKAGRVCGIIGLSIGAVWFVGILIYLSIIGWALGTVLTTMPWEMFSH